MEVRELVMADDSAAATGVLAGSTEGQRVLGRLISSVADLERGVVVLNFYGIHVATGSFLREAVIGLRDFCVSRRVPTCVVLSDVGEQVLDELGFLAESLDEVFVVCSLGIAGAPACLLVGNLDEKQRLAFEALGARKQASAAELSQAVQEVPHIGSTAWNNRLSALQSKGLVLQVSDGRNKQYTSIVEVLNGYRLHSREGAALSKKLGQ